MTQRDAGLKKPLIKDDMLEAVPESSHFWTREVIKENFDRTRDLNVIQIRDTILFEPSDKDKGAAPFIQLIQSMVGKKGRYINRFEAKWLVSDSTQLQHVIRETKTRSKALFDMLTAHATVAIINGSGDTNDLTMRLLNDFSTGGYKTITAFPSNSGNSYDCYGHFVPPDYKGWNKGPLCTLLKKHPSKLDDFLRGLQLAHIEKLTGKNDMAIKALERSGVCILSLEELIAQV